jgi:small lipoprotein (TIGR04454 family)
MTRRPLLIAVALLALTACGHPASVEECEEIVERITRLELAERQDGLDSNAIALEVETTKQEMKERTMKECVGRRITKAAMSCVRGSKKSKEVEECFD